MKKLFVMLLVVGVIFGMSVIAFAADGGSTLEDGANESESFNLTATVGEYADIRGLSGSYDLGEFTGEENEELTTHTSEFGWNIPFQISSNTNIDLRWEIDQPLTHDDNNLSDEIWTKMIVADDNQSQPGGSKHHSLPNKPEAGPGAGGSTQGSFDNVQGKGLEDYIIQIKTKLGDIHDQHAGDYTAGFTLTVSAN